MCTGQSLVDPMYLTMYKEIQNINARQLFKININIKYFGVRDWEVFEGEVIRDDFNQNLTLRSSC